MKQLIQNIATSISLPRALARRLVLLLAVLLVGVGQAWGLRYAKAEAQSSPSEGGLVYVSKSNGTPSYSNSSDESTNYNGKLGTQTFTFYYSAQANSPYVFRGWANSANTNSVVSTTREKWSQQVSADWHNDVVWNPATITRYALFARMTADVSSWSAGDVNVDASASKTITITHAHADKITASITNDSDGSFKIIQNNQQKTSITAVSNSVGLNTYSFTVSFLPQSAGSKTATLVIHSNYTGLSNIEIPLSGTGVKLDQTLTWDDQVVPNEYLLIGNTRSCTATSSISGLPITYSSNKPSILSIDQNTGSLTANAVGTDVTITATQVGNYKYNSISITRKFDVKSKLVPEFTPNPTPDTSPNIYNVKVDDNIVFSLTNVSPIADGHFTFTATKDNYGNDIVSFSRVGDVLTVRAIHEGTTTLTLNQEETFSSPYIFAKSATYTINVTKYDNTLSTTLSTQSLLVEGTSNVSFNYINSDASGIDVSITNVVLSTPSLAVGSNVITYVDGVITAQNAGTATITFSQPATNKYTSYSQSFDITVDKRTPSMTWNAAVPYYFNETYPNPSYTSIFTLSGDAALIDNYTSSDTDVATFVDGVVTTYNVDRTTTLSVHLVENYKWNSQTFTKTIRPVRANNHVPFTYNEGMYNDGSITVENVTDYSTSWSNSDNGVKMYSPGIGGIGHTADPWNDKYITIHFAGIPDKLSFQFKVVIEGFIGATDVEWYVLEGAEDEGGNPIWGERVWESTSGATSWQNTSSIQLQPTTRYLRMCYSGNFSGYFKDITVTELHQFKADPSSVDFGKHGVHDGAFEEFVAFSHANAGYTTNVTLIGANASHFRVSSPVVSNTGGDKMGTEYFTVTYIGGGLENGFVSDSVGKHTATLRFADQLGNVKEIPITGERVKKSVPIFTWNPDGETFYYNESVPNIFITNNSETELTISSTNSSCADLQLETNGTYTLLIGNSGTATITISQEENENWEPITMIYPVKPRTKPSLGVPFAINNETYYDKKSSMSSNETIEWDDRNKRISLGVLIWGGFNWNKKYVEYEFFGQPDSLFFKYKTGEPAVTGSGWRVEESSNGTSWTKAWSSSDNSTTEKSVQIALKQSTRFIRLCYSSNFAGYFYDIRVTALDGIYYMRTPGKEYKYLSRGGSNGTQAVVDDYGIAVRINKTTSDNTNYYSQLQYIDQYESNHKFLYRNGSAVYTDGSNNYRFKEEIVDAAKKELRLKDGSNYLAVNSNSTLEMSSATTNWILEPYYEHAGRMQKLKDVQAIEAGREFGVEVPDEPHMKELFIVNDYIQTAIDLGDQNNPHNDAYNYEVGELYNVYSTPKFAYSVSVDTGLYCLTFKAFQRMTLNPAAYMAYQAGYENGVAYVYARNGDNECRTKIGSVYDSYENKDFNVYNNPGTVVEAWNDYNPKYGVYYPNGRFAAQEAFNIVGRYENNVYIYVHHEAGDPEGKGTIYYGLYSPSNGNCENWLCYQDNGFSLVRLTRKEFTFDGRKDSNWKDGDNWWCGDIDNRGTVPEKMHKVVIAAPAVVGDGANAGAYKITFDPEVQNSSVTVAAGGSLSVREGGFEGDTWNKLVLEADETGQTGALLLHPEIKTMPYATVQFYSTIANKKTDKEWLWQYIGTPIKNPDTNEHILYQCWLYQYSIENDEWTNAGNWGHMEPFRGYAFTRDNYRSSGPRFGFCGQLNDAKRKEQPLYYVVKDGNVHNENQLANSWTAPIRLSNFTAEDFIGVEPNIYYYPRDGKGSVTSIAPFSAEYTGSEIIPAMQGFFVRTKEWTEHKLILDYKRLVWEFEKEGAFKNEPLKAPSRERDTNDELLSRVCINLMSADSIPDHLYLIEKEGEGFSRDFTEGYDAPKYFVDGLPCIYTYETSGTHLAVSATDDVVGTYLAINTGASQNYTLTFSKVIGEGLGLRDLVTNTIVPITEGMQYAFTAPANSSPMLRFVVVEHEETPQWNNNNGTSLEDVGGEFKIWQSGEILSVIGAGSHASLRLYDAAGKLILSEFFNEATAINLNALPTGVYMVQVNDKTEKVLR